MRKTPVILLALLALAAPLAAYTIYLKDGSRIIARERYRVEEGKALITLQNGTQTFIDASEIDVQRTENANLGKHGTALLLEEGRLTEAPITPGDDSRERLSELIARSDSAPRIRPPVTRPPAGDAGAAGQARTPGGYLDFARLPRTAFRNLEIAAEIQQTLRAQGIEEIQIFQGSRPEIVFLDISTNSEASVFRSLEATAEVLLEIRARYPELAGFEILMTTPARQRAGQFTLGEEEAMELAEGGMDPSAFFVRHVQF